jgi:hypothetical protein
VFDLLRCESVLGYSHAVLHQAVFVQCGNGEWKTLVSFGVIVAGPFFLGLPLYMWRRMRLARDGLFETAELMRQDVLAYRRSSSFASGGGGGAGNPKGGVASPTKLWGCREVKAPASGIAYALWTKFCQQREVWLVSLDWAHGDYVDHWFYWELVEVGRKLMMTAGLLAVNFIAPGYAIVVATMVSGSFMLLFAIVFPYCDSHLNWTKLTVSLVEFLTLVTLLFLTATPPSMDSTMLSVVLVVNCIIPVVLLGLNIRALAVVWVVWRHKILGWLGFSALRPSYTKFTSIVAFQIGLTRMRDRARKRMATRTYALKAFINPTPPSAVRVGSARRLLLAPWGPLSESPNALRPNSMSVRQLAMLTATRHIQTKMAANSRVPIQISHGWTEVFQEGGGVFAPSGNNTASEFFEDEQRLSGSPPFPPTNETPSRSSAGESSAPSL